MSAGAIAIPSNGTWALWRTQAAAVVKAELRKNFITKRGFWIYLLAAAPPAVVWMHSLAMMNRGVEGSGHDLAKDTQILAVLFQMFFLRPALYFGCLGIFSWLFRGEVMERSLHYYFLAPIRRDVLVVAKYVAGAITALTFFVSSIALTFLGMYAHFPGYEVSEWMRTAGNEHLTAYVTVTALACLAWGAVFVWMGIRWRNPIIPGVLFLLWESSNVFLPVWLRKISILHYLQSMTPVQGDLRGAAVILGQSSDPIPMWIAVLALLGITAGALLLAARDLRRTEISYSSD
ncbi:MAG TPA: ABC transporter permease [Bryobacteraceae bacterium]|nr:ABC transporter permease [Bryobacteraceae bacterium]